MWRAPSCTLWITQSWLLNCDLVCFHIINWTRNWVLINLHCITLYIKEFIQSDEDFSCPLILSKSIKWHLIIENTVAFLLIVPVVSNQKVNLWDGEETIKNYCNSYIQLWRKNKVKKWDKCKISQCGCPKLQIAPYSIRNNV